ncbi:MAG TPA: ATP synthase subunit I [Burkholderiales bacterium]|nr:ATP synthase subunit I [Burkholderiales bacterium]
MLNELSYTSPPLRRALGKPILTVLKWQFAATVLATLAAALIAGTHGAASAAAGGAVSIVACLASAMVAALGRGNSAGGGLVGALRAEAVKIGLALLLLWLVLSNYSQAAVGVLLGTFVVTMLIFSMAFFVREY